MEDVENLGNPQNREYKNVGGWLLLLCIILVIISPLRTLYSFISSYQETSPYFSQYPALQNLFLVDGLLSLILMFLGIRAGIALWRIKKGAVKRAKNYLLIFLLYSIIAIFLPYMAGFPSSSYDAMMVETVKTALQSFIFFGIWFWYLNVSKRVKATYYSPAIQEGIETVDLESEKLT